MSKNTEPDKIIHELLLVIDDFMPNVGVCTLQNYERLNSAPMRARRWLNASTPDIPLFDGPLQSESEALDVLRKRRSNLIDKACETARSMMRHYESITALDVLMVMSRRGMIDDEEWKLDARWLGAVFKRKDMRQDFHAVGRRRHGWKQRNIHACYRVTWALR